VFELVTDTSTPPAGAAAESVTVPVARLPPTRAVGLTEMPERGGGTGRTVMVVP
jgi:hypothetical protein